MSDNHSPTDLKTLAILALNTGQERSRDVIERPDQCGITFFPGTQHEISVERWQVREIASAIELIRARWGDSSYRPPICCGEYMAETDDSYYCPKCGASGKPHR